MRARDLATFALTALARHRRRTALSLVGLAIGVAAVVLLTALGEGARDYVAQQFEVLGSHVLGVVPGKVETTGAIPGLGGAPHDLTLDDAATLRDRLPGAERVAPIVMGNDTLESLGHSRQALALGTSAEFGAIRGLTVRSGSFLPEGAWDRGAPVAVIGARLAQELFPGRNPLGSSVRMGGWRLRVIGVLTKQGVTFGFDMDEAVVLPVATAMRIFDRTSLVRVAVQMRPGSDMDLAAGRIARMIAERHDEEDVTVTTPEAIIGALDSILGMLTLALAGIAAISLSVAGIGIMNVMLVTVSERRSEIGLLKAIGAARRQVLALFLAEAAVISLVGGLLGVAVGFGLVRVLVTFAPSFPAAPPLWAVVASLALSLGSGLTFGYWPARRAVRLDPIAALAGRDR